VDRDLYRPKRRDIHGAEAIFAHLKRNVPDAQLREATIQLLKTRRDDDATFDWVDGEWVPDHVASRMRLDEAEGPHAGSILSEIRAELLLLRASHRTLKERVRDVQRRIEEAMPSSPPAEENVEEGQGIDSPPAESAPVADALSAPAAPSAAPLDESVPRLTLPTKNAIQTSIKQLLGRELALDHTTEVPAPPKTILAEARMSWLLDESGRELGAILVSARAIAEIGGALLGFPAATIDEHANAGIVSEDSLAAMNEICNSLVAAVKRASSDIHVRAEPLGPVVTERLTWLHKATKSCELSTPSGGRFWLFAR